MQKQGRALLQSVKLPQLLLAASSEAASHNLPATSHQSRALAVSRSSSYRFYQPLPAWLANLAVGGVTAAIVTANLEEVPLTGRMQLQLDCLRPKPHASALAPISYMP